MITEDNIIRHSIEELFGKTIEMSAKDADRLNLEDGVKILVLSPDDGAVFLSLVDLVIMDITGRLAGKLDEEGIKIEDNNIDIYIKEDSINRDGMRIVNEAVQVALTCGVLSYYQSGMPGYEILEQANNKKYMHALNTMAAAQAYRMDASNRVRITQRCIN